MRRILPLIIIYILVHTAGKDSVRAYEGQSAQAIQSLLATEGRTGDVITQKEYQTFIDAHPIVITDDATRTQAKVDLNTSAKTDLERINAIIKYLALDK